MVHLKHVMVELLTPLGLLRQVGCCST